MVANLLGVELASLEIPVTATVDVRGAMAMDPAVPVGVQSMACDIKLQVKEGTPDDTFQLLQSSTFVANAQLPKPECWCNRPIGANPAAP